MGIYQHKNKHHSTFHTHHIRSHCSTQAVTKMDEENVLPIEDPYHTELVSVLQHIDEIRDNNNPNITKLVLTPHEIPPGRLSAIACRLLGRYIANNTHLQELQLSGIGFSDAIIVQLFQELTKSDSITNLNMGIFNINLALSLIISKILRHIIDIT